MCPFSQFCRLELIYIKSLVKFIFFVQESSLVSWLPKALPLDGVFLHCLLCNLKIKEWWFVMKMWMKTHLNIKDLFLETMRGRSALLEQTCDEHLHLRKSPINKRDFYLVKVMIFRRSKGALEILRVFLYANSVR